MHFLLLLLPSKKGLAKKTPQTDALHWRLNCAPECFHAYLVALRDPGVLSSRSILPQRAAVRWNDRFSEVERDRQRFRLFRHNSVLPDRHWDHRLFVCVVCTRRRVLLRVRLSTRRGLCRLDSGGEWRSFDRRNVDCAVRSWPRLASQSLATDLYWLKSLHFSRGKREPLRDRRNKLESHGGPESQIRFHYQRGEPRC